MFRFEIFTVALKPPTLEAGNYKAVLIRISGHIRTPLSGTKNSASGFQLLPGLMAGQLTDEDGISQPDLRYRFSIKTLLRDTFLACSCSALQPSAP